VWQVLQEKHPALCNPVTVGDADGAFKPYPDLPAPIPVCITQDDVEAVSSRLSGAAGPGGTDAVELSNWLLRYRRLWAKCLLKAIGSQATAACGNYNLCAGLQAGIEGAVHAVRAVFADPSLIPAPQGEVHYATD
jgi:hypothetical protein